MNIPILAKAMNHLDDDLISGAVSFGTNLRSQKRLRAVAACLIVCLGLLGFHQYAKHYVIQKNINVQVINSGDSVHVSQEDGVMIGIAQKLHIKFTEQHWDWYGSCYYDLDSKCIIVCLTENTAEHQQLILSNTNKYEIQFENCLYSYQALEAAYNKINRWSLVLRPLGMERHSISVENNCILVRLYTSNNYIAMWMINQLLQDDLMVIYRTGEIRADS